MRQRSIRRRGTLIKRFLQIVASFVLATVGWFLLGDPDELTAAETGPEIRDERMETVVARFDGVDVVTAEEVMAAAASELSELEKRREELISKTVRRVVHERLIAAEARHRGVSPEVLVASEGYEALVSRLEQEHGVEYLAEIAAGADS